MRKMQPIQDCGTMIASGLVRNGLSHVWNEGSAVCTWLAWCRRLAHSQHGCNPFSPEQQMNEMCCESHSDLCKSYGKRYYGTALTHIPKLHHPNLSQFTDTAVGSLWLEEELSQCHLLTPKEFPHLDRRLQGSAPLEQKKPMTSKH